MTPDQQAVVNSWNLMATSTGLSIVRVMGPDRVRHLGARLKEVGLAGMLEAIERIGKSDNCHGANKWGWKAGFTYLLQASSIAKVLEGGLDNRTPARQPFRNGALELLAREWEAPGNAIEGPEA